MNKNKNHYKACLYQPVGIFSFVFSEITLHLINTDPEHYAKGYNLIYAPPLLIMHIMLHCDLTCRRANTNGR